MEDGLKCAYLLDGEGKGTSLDWKGILAWREEQGLLWIHLDRSSPNTKDWVFEKSGLDPVVGEAMLAAETRPRCSRFANAVLVNLRGVNFNPGSTPDEMISIRMFFQQNRVISMERVPLLAVRDLEAGIQQGEGPKNEGELLAFLANRLVVRMGSVTLGLGETIDVLEAEVGATPYKQMRENLSKVRRQITALYRYVNPQSVAFNEIQTLPVSWLGEAERTLIRETADFSLILLEELIEAKERMAILLDEFEHGMSDQMNRTIYLLTILSALLLPLTLFTGLLGINVEGIPGADLPWAFYLALGVMLFLFGVELILLRKLRWI